MDLVCGGTGTDILYAADPHLTHVIGRDSHHVDLVIFVCLNFRGFVILGLLTKFRIREFHFTLFFSSAVIIISFARFSNSRICPPCEICEN